MPAPNKQRDPPPSLFHGPPSQNTSHIALPGILHQSTNLIPNPTSVLPIPNAQTSRSTSYQEPTNITSHVPKSATQLETQKQALRTDALWAEMQHTLEEVEMSASSSGMHVFGPEHNRALAKLREAQIQLAQAWARSEAVDTVEEEGNNVSDAKGGASLGGNGDAEGTAGRGRDTEKTRVLDEETAADILLARKRREANDAYFAKVAEGVVDVVARLEDVAGAMRAVERESRDIWGDTDSFGE